MAFESKKDKIMSGMSEPVENEVKDNVAKKAEAMKKATEPSQPAPRKVAPRVPHIKNEEDNELTKNYSFSLQPSRRKRLDEVVKQSGYRSASKFLNDLISKM